MNTRGQYGISHIGQWAYLDPEYQKKSQEAEKIVWEKHPTRTPAILLATAGAIVLIGIIGAKRGVRFM